MAAGAGNSADKCFFVVKQLNEDWIHSWALSVGGRESMAPLDFYSWYKYSR